jgi:hypothetical protein
MCGLESSELGQVTLATSLYKGKKTWRLHTKRVISWPPKKAYSSRGLLHGKDEKGKSQNLTKVPTAVVVYITVFCRLHGVMSRKTEDLIYQQTSM